MNLIDLYNKNPNSKVQRISDNGYIIQINFANHKSFSEALNNSHHGDVSNTADDWEIIKSKKIIVIERVKWYTSSFGGVLPCDNKQDWGDFLDKPPMKMTLEFEE